MPPIGVDPYTAAPDRYDRMQYRRCGSSGLKLPAISLGLWHNFGANRPLESARAILRRAFDLGVTHIDLANNYGPPYGSAETTFGRVMRDDLRPYRDELVLSTKAGYDMWPGPYGEWGSRKYLLASLDQSLERMGVDYVDIFYSHRFDPETPLEETMGALDSAVRAGKALYAGISSYSPEKTSEAAAILRNLGTPLLIHQPSYSLLNRWIEPDLLDTLGRLEVGCIGFSPLAQGMLTDKYLNGIPPDSRAAENTSLPPDHLSPEALDRIRALNEIARRRGQSLAQLALAWTLRDRRMTSTLIGASSVAQLEDSLRALDEPRALPRRAGRDRPLRVRRAESTSGRAQAATRARAKSSASNGRRSSSPSPTPTSFTGKPSSYAIATAMPPFAEPSSFVRATPVTPTASLKSRACWRPFWPVVASTTSSVSCGAPSSRPAITRRTFASSSIRFVCVCRRPAVSTITTSVSERDRVVGDCGRVASTLAADEARARALRPDLELLLRGGAERVGGAERDRAPVLAQLLRELADRRRLAGAVHADDEDHARRVREVERRGLAEQRGDLLGERGVQLGEVLTRLEPSDQLRGRPDPDVGVDQRLLEPLPRCVVRRIERRDLELLGERAA